MCETQSWQCDGPVSITNLAQVRRYVVPISENKGEYPIPEECQSGYCPCRGSRVHNPREITK